MPPRKHRVPVVLDTNVLVRSLKAHDDANPNRRIVHLWLLERRLQLVVCNELVEEYLGILSDVLGPSPPVIEGWRRRFANDPRSTLVSLGGRPTDSRDPDDNVLLAAASAGKARFLVTNDRDLLEIPSATLKAYRFEVVTPQELLLRLAWDRGIRIRPAAHDPAGVWSAGEAPARVVLG